MSLSVILRQDMGLAIRNHVGLAQSVLFFFLVIFLYRLAFAHHISSPAFDILLIWLTVLLALLLSANGLFSEDYQSGAIELYVLSNHPLSAIVITKMIAYWFARFLPIIAIASIVIGWLDLALTTKLWFILTLLLSSGCLLGLSSLIQAFTLGSQSAGLLLPLVVLPILSPAVLLSLTILMANEQALVVRGHVALLIAIAILCISFSPWLTTVALRLRLEQAYGQ